MISEGEGPKELSRRAEPRAPRGVPRAARFLPRPPPDGRVATTEGGGPGFGFGFGVGNGIGRFMDGGGKAAIGL